MFAMVMKAPHKPLEAQELEIPQPQADEVLIKVSACGICRTDLHVVDGELTEPKLPLIPGHQIVGHVVKCGPNVTAFKIRQRVGVPWLGYSCQQCVYCRNQQENLCEQAKYTGYQIDGGFAEYCVANVHYCFPIPEGYADTQAAPLLCAGLIGYRAYRKVAHCKRIGLYGFGAAAHLLIQVANHQQKEIYALTRAGDHLAQAFAIELGAKWAGDSDENIAEPLDGAIIFAPAGELVPKALQDVRKGGIVVCAGIHMSDIPSFPYHILWGERTVTSIANLTRQDGEEFLSLAPKIPIQSTVTCYDLSEVNQALDDLRHGRLKGAGVIRVAE